MPTSQQGTAAWCPPLKAGASLRRNSGVFEETPHASGLAAGFFSSTRPAIPLTTEQLQKHFGQVERHVVETKAHVARQQQIVKELSLRKESLLKSDLRED